MRATSATRTTAGKGAAWDDRLTGVQLGRSMAGPQRYGPGDGAARDYCAVIPPSITSSECEYSPWHIATPPTWEKS